MSKNIVSVYDTITKRYVEIEVSEKIRTYYNRTQWNIDDNNKSFYKHEIQFSALKGNIWFCQYHLTHFIRTRIMQRERYDHSRAFFGLPEADHRWRCRFFCWPSNS